MIAAKAINCISLAWTSINCQAGWRFAARCSLVKHETLRICHFFRT